VLRLIRFSFDILHGDGSPEQILDLVDQAAMSGRVLAVDGRKFEWHTNDRLRRALELKLFEDQKDSIKLTSLVSTVVDRDTQEKIDVVRGRLIKNFGYDDESATDVLNFVASIFARGDAKE